MNKEELLKDDFAIDTINDIIAERDGYMQQVKDLESNWEALKEWLIEQRKYDHGEDKYGDTLDKMNELEKEND